MQADTNGPWLLERLDRVARELIARAAPVRFATATSDSDRRGLYALRYRTVVEEGWVQPEALPEGLESDVHDADAVHLIGWDGEVMAATVRLVIPGPDRLLPTEEAFELSVVPRGEVVDVGRGIVAPHYRGLGHATFFGLLAAAWLETRALGFRQVCATIAPSMLPHYRAMGFHVNVLGPSRFWWGQERLPIQLDGTRCSAAALEELSGIPEAAWTAHGRPGSSGATGSSTSTGTRRPTRA
jgi:GNAT superfamily N-acetyltransferase